MPTWRCKNEMDRKNAIRVIESRQLPFTMEVIKGTKRSDAQNKLSHKWYKEAGEQGDNTADQYRAYCKLHFGVAIMKEQSELYAEKYNRIIKPLDYEKKLELMGEPFNFPVTSLMTVANEKKYLDQVYLYFTSQGFVLTNPEDRGLEDMPPLPPPEEDDANSNP